MFLRFASGDAVLRHNQLQVAHVGVVRGEEDATVGRDARQDEPLCAKMFKQQLQRRLIKPGMLRLQDEIVVGAGNELLYKRPSADVLAKAVLNDLFEVRLPPAEIIVDVDGGNAQALHTLLERGNGAGHRERLFEKFIAARELEIVDQIDEQKRRVMVIGSAAMQIVLLTRLGPHDNTLLVRCKTDARAQRSREFAALSQAAAYNSPPAISVSFKPR